MTTTHSSRERSLVGERWHRMLSGSGATIVVATVALFAISPVLGPGSLGAAPLLSMLPSWPSWPLGRPWWCSSVASIFLSRA